MSLSLEDLLAAPIGVALLDRLEAQARTESFRPFDAFPDSNPDAVREAVRQVGSMSLGELLSHVLDAAQHLAGPWSGGAPASLALSYTLAPARMKIAEAVWERFSAELISPPEPQLQQCWLGDTDGWERGTRSQDFTRIYGNGEFTWDGLWTVTDPPPEIHDLLISAWEMVPGPITRWRLPVNPDARLWTIAQPSDWVELVESYPMLATEGHSGWELAGPNQHLAEIRILSGVANQHAVRSANSRHVLPDWRAVADDYDGVHLTWSGFVTAEGYVSDLADGGVTMLRYWGSERTLWLRDVFGAPEPLNSPELSGSVGGITGRNAECGDDARTAADLQWMAKLSVRPGPK